MWVNAQNIELLNTYKVHGKAKLFDQNLEIRHNQPPMSSMKDYTHYVSLFYPQQWCLGGILWAMKLLPSHNLPLHCWAPPPAVFLPPLLFQFLLLPLTITLAVSIPFPLQPSSW